jgi:hypothetical protein
MMNFKWNNLGKKWCDCEDNSVQFEMDYKIGSLYDNGISLGNVKCLK